MKSMINQTNNLIGNLIYTDHIVCLYTFINFHLSFQNYIFLTTYTALIVNDVYKINNFDKSLGFPDSKLLWYKCYVPDKKVYVIVNDSMIKNFL